MACRTCFENVVALICGVEIAPLFAFSQRTPIVHVSSTSPSRIVQANTTRAALSWGSLSRCTSPSSLRTPWYLKWPVSRENASHDKLLHQIAMPALHVDVGPFLSLDQGVSVLRRCGVPDLLQFSSGAIWRTWSGYPLGFGVVAADRHFACFLPICAANGPGKYQLCGLFCTDARVNFAVVAFHAHVPANVYVQINSNAHPFYFGWSALAHHDNVVLVNLLAQSCFM